ncbi:amidohydrolase 2, partial [Streptomyces coelicoflavus ZG0656]
MAAGPVQERLAALELVDHHCHGAVTGDLDRAGFESLLTEGRGVARRLPVRQPRRSRRAPA